MSYGNACEIVETDDNCSLPTEEVLLLTAPPKPPDLREPEPPVGLTETLAYLQGALR